MLGVLESPRVRLPRRSSRTSLSAPRQQRGFPPVTDVWLSGVVLSHPNVDALAELLGSALGLTPRRPDDRWSAAGVPLALGPGPRRPDRVVPGVRLPPGDDFSLLLRPSLDAVACVSNTRGGDNETTTSPSFL